MAGVGWARGSTLLSAVMEEMLTTNEPEKNRFTALNQKSLWIKRYSTELSKYQVYSILINDIVDNLIHLLWLVLKLKLNL